MTDGRPEALRQHLESCLADVWAEAPAPVWVADVRGQIVYANRIAREGCDGPGLRHAAARIAEVIGGGPPPAAARPGGLPALDIAPLIDGCGQRVGWLAIGAATR